MNEQKQLFKKVFYKNKYSLNKLFYRVSSWLYDQNLQNITVEKFKLSKVADLQSAALIRMGNFHRHILIHLALI